MVDGSVKFITTNEEAGGSPRRIAILGVGRVGATLARAAVGAGYAVAVAASGDAARIQLTTEILIPGAVAMTAAEAVATSDIVVLAVPIHKFETVNPALLAGKLVIDVMNYWAPVDGFQGGFESAELSSSEIVQARLTESTVVKTFNHLGYHEIEEHARPAGAADRQALGVAGDDAAAVRLVSRIVDDLGFDPVPLASLAAGRILQPGGPFFGVRHIGGEFARALQAAPEMAALAA